MEIVTNGIIFNSHIIHAFDPVHNPLKSTLTIDNASTTKTFAYDTHDQLIAENQNNYTYDSNHNRLSDPNQTYQIDALNQLQPTPTLKASYDPNGNQTQTNTQHLEYDALDRLISVTQNSISHQYQYDPLHRRIKSTTQDTETLYYYDHQNEIGSISSQSTEKRILGHSKGAEIGATVAIELNNEIFTPIHDLYGNIIAIVNDETQTYTYDAFGNHQPSQQNPWRYASKRCDPTGLIYYGKRFYDPTLGRWLTPDPAGYTDSSNLYQYNLNNPNRYIDLYGEEPITITIIIIGAIAAVASEGAVVVGASLVASAAAAAIACYGNQFADYCNRQTREYRAHQEFMDSMTSDYASYDEEEWLRMQKRRKEGGVDPSLPSDPHSDPNFEDISHPRAREQGHHEFRDKGTGETIRYDEGKKGASGHEANNHYHRYNPQSTGGHDKYLDAQRNPVPKGSDASHLYPGNDIS